MKLRIIQKGFENYTGPMGMTLFKNGESVEDVSEREALRLSSCMRFEWIDGTQVKVTSWTAEPSAPVGRQTFAVKSDGKPEKVAGNDGKEKFMETKVSKELIQITRRWTLAELEDIADRKGIAGLREIAGKLGIKGTSINKLINSIMEVAGQEEKVPEGTEIVEN